MRENSETLAKGNRAEAEQESGTWSSRVTRNAEDAINEERDEDREPERTDSEDEETESVVGRTDNEVMETDEDKEESKNDEGRGSRGENVETCSSKRSILNSKGSEQALGSSCTGSAAMQKREGAGAARTSFPSLESDPASTGLDWTAEYDSLLSSPVSNSKYEEGQTESACSPTPPVKTSDSERDSEVRTATVLSNSTSCMDWIARELRLLVGRERSNAAFRDLLE